MTGEVVICVPFNPARLSLNARLHWRARCERNEVAKRAALFAWMDAGCPVIEGPVAVTLTARRARAMDADNLLAGSKGCCDLLFNRGKTGQGVVWDDGPQWVEWAGIRQEIDKRWRGCEELEFRIVPREEEQR